MRSRLLLGAVAVFTLLVVPVAFAASSDSGGPEATASASVKKKVKKLKKQLEMVNQRVDALEGEQGDSRAPSGSAGGDLTGTYPSPAIAANAVGGGEVLNNSLTGADVNEGTLSGVSPGYAHVDDDGFVFAAESRNVSDANVSHVMGTGIYCFSGLGFTPRNVQATPSEFGGTTLAIASVGDTPDCTGSSEQAAVRLFSGESPSAVDFFVLFN